MHHRLPRSTLFPYTTLFRSQDRRAYPRQQRRADRPADHRASPIERDGLARFLGRNAEDAVTAHDVAEDRKSTRLNSSHSQISYAVFCLKKKNAHLQKLTKII